MKKDDSDETKEDSAARLSRKKTGLEKARLAFDQLLDEETSSTFQAWFKLFDRGFCGIILKADFFVTLDKLHFHGNFADLWKELDRHDTGVLSLREISPDNAALWDSFRKYCGARFSSARDMVAQLCGLLQVNNQFDVTKRTTRSSIFGGARMAARKTLPAPASAKLEDTLFSICLQEWTIGLQRCGWTGGQEEELFEAININNENSLSMDSLFWVDAEAERFRQKQEAKTKSSQEQKVKLEARHSRQEALNSFRSYLKKNYGPTYHAWRSTLDLDGSMNLQRIELFKVCRTIGWKGDVRALWQALDYDCSGAAGLEQLDPGCARMLARFKFWAESKFGSKPAFHLWRSLDIKGKNRLTPEQFSRACIQLGFDDRHIKTIVHWLDWKGRNALVHEDLHFLDIWKPPAWLVAEPNYEEAERLKKVMCEKYGHYLRAWRLVMDKDKTNTCDWNEFVAAARQMKFHGDIAGAWLAIDEDVSGSISLREIDQTSNDILIDFKRWADEEFGSVRSAFKVFDSDQSGELSLTEFSSTVRLYGFQGEEHTLFKCLDSNRQGKLLLTDITFLDNWEVPHSSPSEFQDNCSMEHQESTANPMNQSKYSSAEGAINERCPPDSTFIYETEAPGPGTYTLISTFGALPRMPTARHSGSWSFSKRHAESCLLKLDSVGPAPVDLCPDLSTQTRRKPAWSFGTESRPATAGVPVKGLAPGPGSYNLNPWSDGGPKFSFGSRRGVVMHPNQKPTSRIKTSHTALLASSKCFF